MTIYSTYVDKLGKIKRKKVLDKDFMVPAFKDFVFVLENDYRVTQLKQICGHYNQKKTGNKQELIKRVFQYLYLSNQIQHVQKVIRGWVMRNFMNLHGPGLMKRDICINDTDFYTMDKLSTIPYYQFFSFKDTENNVYGFDIQSFCNLCKITKKLPLNPYNRVIIQSNTIDSLTRLIKITKSYGLPIETEIKPDENIAPEKAYELRVLKIFQSIDELGNYSCPEWFTTLTRHQKTRFIRELYDLWGYRLNLSLDIKRNICPHGNPFRRFGLNIQVDIIAVSEDVLNKYILTVMEEFIYYGTSNEFRNLGASYILTCLTLVNHQAAIALPWLYQAASPY